MGRRGFNNIVLHNVGTRCRDEAATPRSISRIKTQPGSDPDRAGDWDRSICSGGALPAIRVLFESGMKPYIMQSFMDMSYRADPTAKFNSASPGGAPARTGAGGDRGTAAVERKGRRR